MEELGGRSWKAYSDNAKLVDHIHKNPGWYDFFVSDLRTPATPSNE
jgi:hypothetical protein